VTFNENLFERKQITNSWANILFLNSLFFWAQIIQWQCERLKVLVFIPFFFTYAFWEC
jgi:hypothetical protein